MVTTHSRSRVSSTTPAPQQPMRPAKAPAPKRRPSSVGARRRGHPPTSPPRADLPPAP
jgi:hypothetical protein